MTTFESALEEFTKGGGSRRFKEGGHAGREVRTSRHLLGRPPVGLEQPAQLLLAANVGQRNPVRRLRLAPLLGFGFHQKLVLLPLVRARTVIVAQEGFQERVHVPRSENQEVIQNFVPQGSDESFDVGVHPGCSKGGPHGLDSLPTEGLLHSPGEFRVSVVDNVPDGQSALAGLLHEGLRLGLDPGFVRMFRGRSNDGAPGVDMQKRDHEYLANARHRQHFLAEEVHLPEGRGVAFQELIPGSLPSDWAGWEIRLPQNSLDGALGQRDSKFRELAPDPPVAPSVLAGQFQDQPTNRECGHGAAPLSARSFLPVDLRLSDPAKERSRSDDGHELVNGLPQLFSHLQEPLALRARDGDPVGKLAPEDFVLDLEIPDLASQFFVRRRGDYVEDRVEDAGHRRNPLKCCSVKEMTSFWHPRGGRSVAGRISQMRGVERVAARRHL